MRWLPTLIFGGALAAVSGNRLLWPYLVREPDGAPPYPSSLDAIIMPPTGFAFYWD